MARQGRAAPLTPPCIPLTPPHTPSQVEREERLRAQHALLKEELAKRIVLQTLRSCVLRCWKAWSVYALKRQLQRQIAPETLSDEEAPEAAAPDGLLGKAVQSIGRLF